MSSLNGRKMQVGDVVYDVLKGMGQVVRDGGGVLNVVVRFSEGNEMAFQQDGKFQGVQRLYWKPPYFVQPKGPDDDAYDQTVRLAKAIYDELSKAKNTSR